MMLLFHVGSEGGNPAAALLSAPEIGSAMLVITQKRFMVLDAASLSDTDTLTRKVGESE